MNASTPYAVVDVDSAKALAGGCSTSQYQGLGILPLMTNFSADGNITPSK